MRNTLMMAAAAALMATTALAEDCSVPLNSYSDGGTPLDGVTLAGPPGFQFPVVTDGQAALDSISDDTLTAECSDHFTMDWDKLNDGMAVAAGLDVPQVETDKKFALSGGLTGFTMGEGIGAAANAGLGIRLTDTWQLGAGGAMGLRAKSGAGKVQLMGQW